MATVQRANVILQIADEPDLIQKYKDKGFNVIDRLTGKILERAMPHESGALLALVQDLKKELVEKDKVVDELKKELEEREQEISELEEELTKIQTAKKSTTATKTVRK